MLAAPASWRVTMVSMARSAPARASMAARKLSPGTQKTRSTPWIFSASTRISPPERKVFVFGHGSARVWSCPVLPGRESHALRRDSPVRGAMSLADQVDRRPSQALVPAHRHPPACPGDPLRGQTGALLRSSRQAAGWMPRTSRGMTASRRGTTGNCPSFPG